MVKNQASRMPNATNTPNTWTGGIGVNASDPKPAADVSEVNSIGRAVSSGCIRLLNADVIDLYDRVPIGTRVVVRKSRGEVMAEAARDIGADLGEAARSIGDALRRAVEG